MATTSAVNAIDSGADATLAHQLAIRFTAALLPAEAADFEAARIAEAARFTLAAAASRPGSEPAIAIESIGGQSARYR